MDKVWQSLEFFCRNLNKLLGKIWKKFDKNLKKFGKIWGRFEKFGEI